MAKCYCPCGTAYGVPEASLGKKAKCRKCGAVFTLKEEKEESGIFAIADEAWPDTDPDAGRAGTGVVASPVAVSPADDGVPSDSVGMPGGANLAAVPAHESRSYVTNVLWTFLFPSAPASLISFLIAWVILVVGMFASNVPLVGWACAIIVAGWYCAFLFNVLQSAAAGDDVLPDVAVPTDIVGDLLGPLFSWLGSWFIVVIPAILYLIVAWQQGFITVVDILEILLGGLGSLWQATGSATIIYYVLLGLGAAAWPMVILCVVLGGFSCLSRIDLIIKTIFRTLPVYLLTIALMFGAVALSILLSGMATARTPSAAGNSAQGAMSNLILMGIVLKGIGLYLDIVLVRLVGLYYHHFKSRFAWSWG